MNKIQSPITQSTNVKQLDVYDKYILRRIINA